MIILRSFIIVIGLAISESAQAHGIAGNRFFPGTMAFDDPAVADEFLMEQLSLSHPPDTDSAFNVIDNVVDWSFVRLLTSETSIAVNGGWIHRGGNGFPTRSGFDQSSITFKALMYRNDLHETLISASLTWGIGGSGAQWGPTSRTR
jgi:hypothetical protein